MAKGIIVIVGAILLAGLIYPAAAKKRMVGPDNGIALRQDEGSERVGWYAALIGHAVLAGPRYRHWNVVTVDSGPYRYQWQELREDHRLVFTINEQFQFWRYGSLFLVVDVEGKTHKFALVGALKR